MKKILINDNVWQTRIAITLQDELQNIYFSAHAQKTLERAFFKGTVLKVLPGIQTAFIDIGQERAGFLHISEIDREMAISEISKRIQLDDDQEPTEHHVRKQLDISKILHEGEQILVQASKEPVYEKGAKLTTCFTLPGRFLVLMPNIPRIGVSKKIAERDERLRLKDIIKSHLPEGMGAIIRTTSEDRKDQDIIKDLNYLIKTWRTIEDAYAQAKPTEKIYQDLPLPLQIVRDHLDNDIDTIITDSKNSQQELYNFIKATAPEYSHKVNLYKGDVEIFDQYGIEKQIERALEKKVILKSGGSLIIESTEAMTVVDVNTGKFTGKGSLEETIFKTNMEAAEEIVCQLKLRNIGGLIVIDFIDMKKIDNKEKVFRLFEKILREQDKFQSVVRRISEFGTVQMTRKRSGLTLQHQLTDNCFTCKGNGFLKSIQTECYSILGNLKTLLSNIIGSKNITFYVNPQIFNYISSTEYNAILEIEKLCNAKVILATNPNLPREQYYHEHNKLNKK